MKKASLVLSAVAMAALVSQVVAQEKAPAPTAAPKGAVMVAPAPAHGYAAPTYNCQPDCCNYPNQGGCSAGIEFTLLKPHYSNGVTIAGPSSVEDEDDNDVLINLPSARYVDAQFEAGFRVWAAYLNCDGMGARVRYWRMGAKASATFVPVGEEAENDGDDNPRTNTDDLQVDVLDLEGIGQYSLGGGTLTASAGLRLARVDFTRKFQKGPTTDTDTNDDTEVLGVIDISTSNSDFGGFGPTLAIEFIYPVNCNMNGFVSSRASLLYGQTDLTLVTGITNEATNTSPIETRQGQNDATMTYVVEFSIGAEYTCCCGGKDMFVRAAFEAQWWSSVMHHGLLRGNWLTGDDDRGFERAAADDSLGFAGLTLTAGIKY